MYTQANILEQHEQYVKRVTDAVGRIQTMIDNHENRAYADEMQTFLNGVYKRYFQETYLPRITTCINTTAFYMPDNIENIKRVSLVYTFLGRRYDKIGAIGEPIEVAINVLHITNERVAHHINEAYHKFLKKRRIPMIEKPFVADYEDDLEAFRRLSPRERIEQLTLKLDTDAAFVARFKDAFDAWEEQYESATEQPMDEEFITKVKDDLYNKAQQEESATMKSAYKFLLHSSCGVTDK